MAILKDLTGQKFGRLTVLEFSHKDKAQYLWSCKCECGSIITAKSGNLKNGTTKSCGCLSKPKDLTGLTFGKLTVIDYSHKNKDGRHFWNCVCDCGAKKKISGGYLNNKRGFNKSCGCSKKEYNESRSETFEDLTGQKFGRLTVLGFYRKEEHQGKDKCRGAGLHLQYRYYWDCICECGNKIITTGNSLKSGHTKSCGCYMIDRAKSQLQDLTGLRSGKLVVEKFSHIKNECSYWLCRCDCGNGHVVRGDGILKGLTKSCGCSRNDKNINSSAGNKKSMGKVFQTWSGMINRCCNKSNPAYKYYGGRGIEVCNKWRLSFDKFCEDMGIPYDGYSIDRIDVNGNYCPENCRWASTQEQNRNKRNNVNIIIFNTTMCAAAWGDISKVTGSTILGRLGRGWDNVAAVFTPSSSKRGTGYQVVENKIINLDGVAVWNY